MHAPSRGEPAQIRNVLGDTIRKMPLHFLISRLAPSPYGSAASVDSRDVGHVRAACPLRPDDHMGLYALPALVPNSRRLS
jgi:hypothetical protein